MIKKSYTLLIVFYMFTALSQTDLFAQDVAGRIDSLFNAGVVSYERGDYRRSLEQMRALDQLFAGHYRSTSSLLMQGKALYKLRDYTAAEETFNQLKKDFPKSSYFDDADYGLGEVYYRVGQYKEAVRHLLSVVEESNDLRLQKKAAKLSADIMLNVISNADLQVLFDELLTEKGKAAVTIKLAQRAMRADNFLTAKNYLKRFLDLFPKSEYGDTLRNLMAQAEEQSRNSFSIGVILPLSGTTGELGKQLLSGIQFAVDQYNEQSEASIRLVVRDSQDNIITAVKAAQELCANGEILAIIGELESDKTAAIAGVAQENGVPLLAPTASLDGIAQLGDCIFQLNSSVRIQAQQLASFAVKDQNLRHFAILYPATVYGKSMRDAFVETVNSLGGEIISEKYYFKSGENWGNYIGEQVKAIRKEGLARMLEDSLLVRLPPDELTDDLSDLRKMEGVIGPTQTLDDLVDSTDLAVTSIDCIFVPSETEELPVIIPQLATGHFRAQIIGSSQWYDLETLQENSQYTDGILFPSDYFVDPSDYAFYAFSNAFRLKMKRTPGQLEIYGYDTIKLLLRVLADKNISRTEIAAALRNTPSLQVLHGFYKIDAEGYNEALHILRYRNGSLLKVN